VFGPAAKFQVLKCAIHWVAILEGYHMAMRHFPVLLFPQVAVKGFGLACLDPPIFFAVVVAQVDLAFLPGGMGPVAGLKPGFLALVVRIVSEALIPGCQPSLELPWVFFFL